MTIEQIEQCDRCGEYFTALHGTHNCRPGVIAIPHKRQVLFEQNVNYSPENDRTRLYALQANVEDLISSIRIAEMHQGSDCCVDGLYCWKPKYAKDVLLSANKLKTLNDEIRQEIAEHALKEMAKRAILPSSAHPDGDCNHETTNR